MPESPPSNGRDVRREAILELLRSRAVRSQAELRQLLERRGLAANQATLSRDLRDLGVVKGRHGYELPAEVTLAQDAGSSLWHTVQEWLVSATRVQNQVVLRTPPGGAQPLALALDNSDQAGLVGTIAGDDTVLAVCADAGKARSLVRRLQKLKGGRP